MKTRASLIFFFCALSLSAFSTSYWNGSATEWTTGSGDATNPYLIETAENLAYLAQSVNSGESYDGKFFVLTDDINLGSLDWTPIGGNDNKFSGQFIGSNHTIEGIKVSSSDICVGLFGYSTGTIRDLTVSGEVKDGIKCVGGIVGCNSGTIENCSNKCSVSPSYSESLLNVGGIAGVNKGNILRCSNSGSVSSWGYAPSIRSVLSGGIAGDNENGTISCCKNTGSVSAVSCASDFGAHVYAGGIAAYNSGTIEYSSNTASVSASIDGFDASANAYSGGIAGESSKLITKCFNTGNVSGSSTVASQVGGICGDATEREVSFCFNRGKVESTGSEWAFAAGLANGAIASNSYNVGTVTSDKYAKSVSSKCTNCYFLESCGGDAETATSKSADEMRSDFFPALLNGSGESFFIQDTDNTNDGYPLLVLKCEETPTTVTEQSAPATVPTATKFIENGRILIKSGAHIYDMSGARVR